MEKKLPEPVNQKSDNVLAQLLEIANDVSGSFHGQETPNFKRGDLVLGKFKCFPWWPAIIINQEDCFQEKCSKDRKWLYWFGDHKFSEIPVGKIKKINQSTFASLNKCKGKLLKIAFQEAMDIICLSNNQKKMHMDNFIKWVTQNKLKSTILFKWNKPDLPYSITQSLLSWKEQDPSFATESDSDCEILQNIKDESVDIESVCIACFEKTQGVVARHPIFRGGICKKCIKDVTEACSLPFGHIQTFCIICGQGGSLVYCSNSICCRAYCKVCLEYMISEEAYKKILQDNLWICYICNLTGDPQCVIKTRIKQTIPIIYWNHDGEIEKKPITVIGFNEIGRKVLKFAKIKIGTYLTEPKTDHLSKEFMMEYGKYYIDFNKDQIKHLVPNLILGSFFCFSTWMQNDSAEMFFASFFRFVFRLQMARLANENVFFIFVAESHTMTSSMLEKVQKFISVEPASLTWEKREIKIWSNFTKCVMDPFSNLRRIRYTNEEHVEEETISPLVNFLTRYFETEENGID